MKLKEIIAAAGLMDSVSHHVLCREIILPTKKSKRAFPYNYGDVPDDVDISESGRRLFIVSKHPLSKTKPRVAYFRLVELSDGEIKQVMRITSLNKKMTSDLSSFVSKWFDSH